MSYLLVGVLLLGLLLGGAGMKRHLRAAGAVWRPGAGVLALVCFVLAAIMAMRKQFFGAAFFLSIGIWLAVSARRRAGEGRSSFGPRPKTGMSVSDAAGILGVSETATAEEVQAAYLRLMRRAHPDSGGTSGLAQQLNAARETLLKKR
jgi:hypothetical protein